MIGIVIVSHSSKIAAGVVELCSQMAHKDLKIIPAGGTKDGEIGTDAIMISEAILKANEGDGVLILVDLGSAILNTEMALDFIDDTIKDRVMIADAPIVEGSIAATVQASISNSIEEIKLAAEEVSGFKKTN
ncbi:MAG: dihydroxyacetone kinase phosphoryl donor subunit DhaM [Alkaliphilus sp.]